jgi:hypothetical protein
VQILNKIPGSTGVGNPPKSEIYTTAFSSNLEQERSLSKGHHIGRKTAAGQGCHLKRQEFDRSYSANGQRSL